MFNPTHVLISRSRETPVQLSAGPRGYWLYTEKEWLEGRDPAFELRPKLGFYCLGTPVVGFRLEPMPTTVEAQQPQTATIQQ